MRLIIYVNASENLYHHIYICKTGITKIHHFLNCLISNLLKLDFELTKMISHFVP